MPVNAANKDNNQSNQAQHKTSKQSRPTELTTHDKYLTFTYDSHGRILYKTQTPLGKDGQALKQSGSAIVGYRNSLLRLPPGHDLAHWRGYESKKGFDYTYTELNTKDLHRTQHRYDDKGRKNKPRSSNKCLGRSTDVIRASRI